ncbi:TonB-dependent receptor [Sphingorhabdus sp. YGSMI21]|uniref:TonB-dependent receptor n=1 Tax=Sphingorhabdus sp. YGSMI21 TaxID=2077182 RepID=UPI000C1E26E9|nr:TonB-dependent receptor [Sphingorhabdus sp. YGSMI21]ATW05276.1 hypothetical protein CHN51_18390 [Sphingorhabdus sp. YGSMI21]
MKPVLSPNARLQSAVRLAKIGLMASVLIPSSTFAQAIENGDGNAEVAADDTPFGEIVVTAQKRDQNTQDIGIAIAAFGAGQMEALGVVDVKDIATLVPGFTVAKSFRGPPIYTLRGVGFNTPNMSTSSPVGVYLDEIAYPYPIMTEGLSLDLSRVEVLKGPQGTLYGRNTTGGLINSIANKPTSDQSGEVKLSAGSYQSYGVEGFLNGGIAPNLNARLAFDIQRADKGWQVSVTHGQRLGKVDKAAARFSLGWEPSDSAKFLLTANWWKDKSDTQAGQSIAAFPRGLIAFLGLNTPAEWQAAAPGLGLPTEIFSQSYTPTSGKQANWVIQNLPWGGMNGGGNNFTPAPLDFRKNNEMLSFALRGEVNVTDAIKLTSLTSYAHFTRHEGYDTGGWDIENLIGLGEGSIKSFSQELRLSGDSDRLHWVAGAFFARDKIRENDKSWGATISTVALVRTFGLLSAPPSTTTAQLEDIQWGFRDWENLINQTVTSKAVFGQVEYKLNDQLNLTFGMRYTKDKAEFSGCSKDQGDNSIAASWNAFFNYATPFGANVQPGGCVTYLADLVPFGVNAQGMVSKVLDEDNLSGRIALDYHVNDDVLIYASAARGFKSGAFPNINANVAPQYDPAKQEEVRAFEVGIKTSPARGMIFNTSAFYYDYRDKQLFVNTPDPVYVTLNSIKNIPKSHIFGIEGELSVPLFRGLDARVTATYLNAKIDTYSGFNDFGQARDFAGASFPFTPKFQLNGTLTYGFDVGPNLNARLTANGRYSSSSRGDLEGDPLFRIDGYPLFDTNLAVMTNDDNYQFDLFVRNIGNKYYWNSVQLPLDSLVRYAGMPRTWGVSFKAKF